MRILVCGSQEYNDRETIKKELVKRNVIHVINGGARGADALAVSIARELKVGWETHMADWGIFGKAAGPIRNKRMLDRGKPDIVLAFFAGKRTPGTQNMVKQAKKAGVPVVEFGLNDNVDSSEDSAKF